MRKTAVLVVVAIGCAVSSGVAAGADHTQIGTPGQPNCVGQTNAALAQTGKNQDLQGVRGIGGLVRYANDHGNPGLTVQDLQGIVKDYCAGA